VNLANFNNRAKNNFTIANFITVSGLVVDLWNNYLIFNGLKGWTPIFLITIVIASDFFDGLFARRRNAKTWVGSNLDKLRDKVFSLSKFYFKFLCYWSLLACQLYWASFILVLLTVLTTIELILFTVGSIGMVKDLPIEANKWGKRKMFFECLAIGFWSIGFFISPSMFSNGDLPNLIPVIACLLISIYHALKSLEGYRDAYKAAKKI